MSLPQVPNGAVNAEVVVNQLMAALAHGFTYCHDYRPTGGLKRGYLGGRWKGFAVADSDHTFGASTTTYVSAARADGALNFSTSNTNYNNAADYARVEVVVTDGSGVTAVTDGRADEGGVHESGGSAGAGTSVACIPVACSDEATALTTGTAKVTFRMPFAMTGVTVRASLTTAQSSGSIFTVDVNESGSSILSTKLTIDNTEKTSTTAATPAVVSDSSLADDAEITIDIDQVGDGTAKGLKVYLIGVAV